MLSAKGAQATCAVTVAPDENANITNSDNNYRDILVNGVENKKAGTDLETQRLAGLG